MSHVAAKSIINTVARDARVLTFQCRHYFPPKTKPFSKLNYPEFVEKMRKNLIDRSPSLNLDEMIGLYHRYEKGEDVEEELRKQFFALPNFTHPNTPIGDPSKYKILSVHGTPSKVPRPKTDMDLLSNELVPHKQGNRGRRAGLGLLRSTGGLVTGCGPRSYVFYDNLARLESALVKMALDRAKKAGFKVVMVPDVLTAEVIQGCGFSTTGERNQIFKIADRREVGEASKFCLSGTGEMGLAGYCSNRLFGTQLGTKAESFCTVSRCYRQEVAQQESLLYRNHQFTKVEMFCVCRPDPEIADSKFEEIVEFQRNLFSSLGLHYRVLEMPTSELGDPANRKIDIEAHMPGEGIFGEVSSASNCIDYQATRLTIGWMEPELKEAPYAYTLNGTGCAVTRTIKALVETHQNSDGSINIPQALWPYMGGVTKLEPGEVPIEAS